MLRVSGRRIGVDRGIPTQTFTTTTNLGMGIISSGGSIATMLEGEVATRAVFVVMVTVLLLGAP
jgi:hypothetical protein